MKKQHLRILQYLLTHETISPMEAWNELSITKLSTRISEMRDEGHTFIKRRVTTTNKYGEPVSYMTYALDKTESEA